MADDNSKHTYTYVPLGAGEIRVLTLLPGSFHEPLQGTLEVVPLYGHEPFKALSYAWGDENFEETISLDNGKIQVTKSLHGALRRFRDTEHASRLWADQICINSHNIDEQSHQISIMSRIYGLAKEVMCWLGEASKDDVLAFLALRAISRHAVLTESYTFETDQQARASIDEILATQFTSSNGRPSCPCCSISVSARVPSSDEFVSVAKSAIYALMSRQYFSRLWPVQEVALGEQSIYFCGSHSIDFDSLNTAMEALSEAQVFAPFFRIKFGQFSLLADACKYPCSILETIIETGEYDVSLPHDRVYAIRPLTSETDDAKLYPDYNLPLSELWQDVALCSLQSKPLTRVSAAHDSVALALAGASACEIGLHSACSWLTDLSNFRSRCLWKKLKTYVHAQNYCSGGHSVWYVNYTPTSPAVVHIPGQRIDIIANILPASSPDFVLLSTSAPKQTVQDRWHEIETSLVPWYIRCKEFLYSSPNLPRNKYLPAYPSTSHPGVRHNFAHFLRQADLWTGLNGPPLDECRPYFERGIRSHVTDKLRQQSYLSVDGLNDMYEDLFAFTAYDSYRTYLDMHRVLARSTSGRVGWVPKIAKQGDCLCLLQGAPFPFVFREKGDSGEPVIESPASSDRGTGEGEQQSSMTNLGDAYVHGIMYGEAWPERAEEDGKLEIFRIV